MQECTSSVKTEWALHLQKAESHYHEDTSAVEHGKKDMEEVLQNWYDLNHPTYFTCKYFVTLGLSN